VLVVEDLGSTNGTLLNDEPLAGPQPLHHGDRIRIGDSELTYLQD
jgi:pSer/pThr/pTyr-binding forkhead associated (FHA) protein